MEGRACGARPALAEPEVARSSTGNQTRKSQNAKTKSQNRPGQGPSCVRSRTQ